MCLGIGTCAYFESTICVSTSVAWGTQVFTPTYYPSGNGHSFRQPSLAGGLTKTMPIPWWGVSVHNTGNVSRYRYLCIFWVHHRCFNSGSVGRLGWYPDLLTIRTWTYFHKPSLAGRLAKTMSNSWWEVSVHNVGNVSRYMYMGIFWVHQMFINIGCVGCLDGHPDIHTYINMQTKLRT